jgi:hypothetical protein
MASLIRRPRNCVVGVRPKPFAPDSLEMVELALCLAVRAEGCRSKCRRFGLYNTDI